MVTVTEMEKAYTDAEKRELIRKARNEAHRKWAAEHKDKVKEYSDRHFLKKALASLNDAPGKQ